MAEEILITLEELVDEGQVELTTGPFGTQLAASEYQLSGVPVINVRNVGLGDVRHQNLEFVGEATAERLSRHLLRPGDIVFGRKGAVERHAFISDREDGWLQGSDCIRLRFASEVINPHFVSIYLRTPVHQQWMKNFCSSGATMASLNQEILCRIVIPTPTRARQDAICLAVSAFDDLIENNRRRIELLEETARLLYLEWFVRFQYPGYEDVPLVGSVHGSRPENWGHTTMGEIAELSRAAANPSEIPSLSPILSLGDLPYRSTTLHEWDLPEVAGSRKTEFKSGDILFAKLDPGSHKAVWAPIDGFCSTDILAFRATESQFASLILSIASSDHFVAVAAKTANGTTHIRVSPDVLLNYPVLLPPAAILDEFDRVVSPMVRLCSHLATTNRCLREARNLLLPRLVSGDLDISDLDLSLEAVG